MASIGPVTGRVQGIAYSHQLKRWGIVSRATTRAGRAQGIAPTMVRLRASRGVHGGTMNVSFPSPGNFTLCVIHQQSL